MSEFDPTSLPAPAVPPALDPEALKRLGVAVLTPRVESLIDARLTGRPSTPGMIVLSNLEGQVVEGDLSGLALRYTSDGSTKDVEFSKLVAPDGSTYYQIGDWGYHHPEFPTEGSKRVATQWQQGGADPKISRTNRGMPIMPEEVAGYELGLRSGVSIDKVEPRQGTEKKAPVRRGDGLLTLFGITKPH